MRIDIIHERDPDSSCDLTVYVDGVKVDHNSWSFDPGEGMEIAEYDEWRDNAIEAAPEFLKPILDRLFEDYRGYYEEYS